MDRLIHFPIMRLFVMVAVFWLTYFSLWENLQATILFLDTSIFKFIDSHIYQQDVMYHPLSYIAVVSNLLFVGALNLVGLPPQRKIAAGILLFFWQISVLFSLFYNYYNWLSFNWAQELVSIILWAIFSFLFISRWVTTNPPKRIWVYGLLMLGVTFQQSSETTLAAMLEIRDSLRYYGNYFLIASLIGFILFYNRENKMNNYSLVSIFKPTSQRFIFFALLFLLIKTFPSLLPDSIPQEYSFIIGNHWITIFSIGFIYYLTPIVFHKKKMRSLKLMEAHFCIVVVGYSLTFFIILVRTNYSVKYTC